MNKPLAELERIAAELRGVGDIDHPDWIDCFQSWRSYIPKEIREQWETLPREAKLMAVLLGDELARRENWE